MLYKIKKPTSSCCAHDACSTEQKIIIEEVPIQIDSNSISTTFKVANMDCADEIKAVNDALRTDGVFEVKANLMASTIQIIHRKTIEKDFLKKKINATVVKVIEENSAQNHNLQRVIKVALSGTLLIFGLILEKFGANAILPDFLYAFSILIGGTLIFPKAYSALKRKSLGYECPHDVCSYWSNDN